MGIYGSPDLTPKDDTFKGMVRCRKCGNAYHHDLKRCPNCGAPKTSTTKAIVVLIIVFVICGAAFLGWKNLLSNSAPGNAIPSGNAPSQSIPSREESSSYQSYSLGQTLSTKAFNMTLLQGETNSGNMLISPGEGKLFLFMEFEFENLSKQAFEMSSIGNFKCYVDDYLTGFCFNALMASADYPLLDGTVDPGRKVKGWLYYEVPQNAKEIEILFMPNGESGVKYSFIAVANN